MGGKNGFVSTTFQELIDRGILEIGDGYRAKNRELGGDGLIFLRAGHVSDTHIDFDGVDRFQKKLESKLQHKMARPGDTIVTTKGNSTGRTSFVSTQMPPFVYSPHLSYWRTLNEECLSSGFLRYWSQGREFERQLSSMKASTDMAPYLSLTDQRRLRITLLPPREQRAIAGILGALDDKIELNRRMNETLETMARAIFKSWFVDFDPVRAKLDGRQPVRMDAETAAMFPDSFEHTELGLVPKGWRIKRVGDEFNLTMGQSPPGHSYNEDGEGLPFFQGRKDFGFRFPTRRVYCTAPTRFAESGDTLVSVRAPVGDLNMATERCCVGRGVAAVRHKSGSKSFTYYTMRELEEDFARFEAEGTVFGSINKTNFEGLPVLAPPSSLIAALDRLIGPLDDHIEGITKQVETLTTTRDALMQTLLSGEIRVSNVEKFVGEVA